MSSALVPHLLRAFLFINLKMLAFLSVFLEKWQFQFLPNWFCMLIFFFWLHPSKPVLPSHSHCQF